MSKQNTVNKEILVKLNSNNERDTNDGYSLLRKTYSAYLFGVIKNTIRHYKELDGTMLFDEALEKISVKSRGFQLQDASKLKTWLSTVVRNHCIDAIRKEESRRRKAQRASVQNSGNESDDEYAFVIELGADRLLRKLKSEHQRRCLFLKYVNKMKYQEIADKLELPINTVRSHIRRGKQNLKKILEA
jgi:RNA polymerase sigma-70 factor (ECF subfamily)